MNLLLSNSCLVVRYQPQPCCLFCFVLGLFVHFFFCLGVRRYSFSTAIVVVESSGQLDVEGARQGAIVAVSFGEHMNTRILILKRAPAGARLLSNCYVLAPSCPSRLGRKRSLGLHTGPRPDCVLFLQRSRARQKRLGRPAHIPERGARAHGRQKQQNLQQNVRPWVSHAVERLEERS